MATLLHSATFISRLADGTPNALGQVYTYVAGTLTPQATYTTQAGDVPNTNPVTLGADGCAQVWLDSSLTYRVIEKTAALVTIRDVDNITGSALADLASTASGKGDALIGVKSTLTGGTARTQHDKNAETVSVGDFGAVGDGATDDTAAIQSALSSTAKVVAFVSGKTYLVNGGLTSSVSDRTIIATGATIKLKDNAASKYVLNVSGSYSRVVGGSWDGNKSNGNAPVDTYTSYAIGLIGFGIVVEDTVVYNFHGIGLKGIGSELKYKFNTISGTTHYGIFIDGAPGANYSGNQAIGNNIDMTEGGLIGQGILFTAATGQFQKDYIIEKNVVFGPSGGTIADQAINLAVRGKDGLVADNITRFGSMGFSEGGDNCVITGNRFLELRGTSRIGIEPSGRFTASNNIITESYVGIDCTFSANYDNSVITGGFIEALTSSGIGVRVQTVVSYTARNMSIGGGLNIKTGGIGVYLVRDAAGANLNGLMVTGPGIGSGRGVYLDTLPAAAQVTVQGCQFRDFQRVFTAYSAGALTYTDLRAWHNPIINCGGDTTWTPEGSATIGARCSVLGASNGMLNVYDVAANLFHMISGTYNNPEGLLTAGIGSVHVSTNSSGGVYRKNTGTGNTGWVAM